MKFGGRRESKGDRETTKRESKRKRSNKAKGNNETKVGAKQQERVHASPQAVQGDGTWSTLTVNCPLYHCPFQCQCPPLSSAAVLTQLQPDWTNFGSPVTANSETGACCGERIRGDPGLSPTFSGILK